MSAVSPDVVLFQANNLTTLQACQAHPLHCPLTWGDSVSLRCQLAQQLSQ